MKKNFLFLLLCVISLIYSSCTGRSSAAEEDIHINYILKSILTAKDTIAKQAGGRSRQIFLTVWDFDGTILKGDCTAGYMENDRKIYKGLAEIAIESGYSKKYKKNEFDKYWDYHQKIEAEHGKYVSFTYAAKIFSGSSYDSLYRLADAYIDTYLKNYYYISSVKIINTLLQEGVEVFIISTSPEFFVKGAADSLGIPLDHFIGIKSRLEKGTITDAIEQPLTFSDGKVKALQDLILKLKKENQKSDVYVLAGFGNSYTADGPILKWISEQKLPKTKPLSVMINGRRAPGKYSGKFYEVNLEENVSKI